MKKENFDLLGKIIGGIILAVLFGEILSVVTSILLLIIIPPLGNIDPEGFINLIWGLSCVFLFLIPFLGNVNNMQEDK